jgi:hypothetical protein
MFQESPEVFMSGLPDMPPPPPIRASSSSSWLFSSDLQDPFSEARLPEMNLMLSSPTCPQTPNPPLQQRKPKDLSPVAVARKDKKIYKKVAHKGVETETPRPFDVICSRIPKQDTSRWPGNAHYHSLVDQYGSQLAHEQQSLQDSRGRNSTDFFSTLKREFAVRIVQMVRERDGLFLFKTKDDRKFYDIGDAAAIRKTRTLLQKKVTAAPAASPNPNEFGRQLMSQDLSETKPGGRELEDVFELLTIPSRSVNTVTPHGDTMAALKEIKPPPLFPEQGLSEEVLPSQPERSQPYPPTIQSATSLTNRPYPLSCLEATDICLPFSS